MRLEDAVILRDADGRESLEWSGSGYVTAVAPFAADGHPVAVDIDCLPEPGGARAIRRSLALVLPADHPCVPVAEAALADGACVDWVLRWERHADVPPEVPARSLDLASDGAARLARLVLHEGAEQGDR